MIILENDMKKNRNAFTMIELVFVIVVLGILASIAVPKISATRVDAQIAKARSDISSIRSAIITERQERLFRGQSMFISALDAGVGNGAGVTIFDGNGTSNLLQYGITTKAGNGGWLKSGANTYTFTVKGITNTFTYNNATGTFLCTNGNMCATLTQN